MSERKRFLLTTSYAELIPELESYEQSYKLPFGRCDRYGIKGVRSSHVDILIQQSEREYVPVIEVSERNKNDSGQWRLCIRADNVESFGDLIPVSLNVSKHSDIKQTDDGEKREGRCIVELLDPVGERMWCWSGQYFTETVDDWWGIYQFHRTRFYPFLSEQDCIDQFGGDLLPENATLNQANRFVSRSLYRLARNLGYRREANRKSPNFQKWTHETRGLIQFSDCGVGQATLEAATGKPVEFNPQDGD